MFLQQLRDNFVFPLQFSLQLGDLLDVRVLFAPFVACVGATLEGLKFCILNEPRDVITISNPRF